jgi:hypothetical protein
MQLDARIRGRFHACPTTSQIVSLVIVSGETAMPVPSSFPME